MPAIEGLLDRLHGLSLGHAMGDSIGGPTSLAQALAQSLNNEGEFCPDHVRNAYLNWWREDGHDCGLVFHRVLALVDEGTSWQMAVEAVNDSLNGLTGGCNPAHRAIPLVYLPVSNDELESIARSEARLTHLDPMAGTVSAATILICRILVEGGSWEKAVEQARGKLSEFDGPSIIWDGSKTLSIKDLKRDGYAPNVLRAALFFVTRSQDFESALREAFEFAGPRNYCPVLVGAMAGARFGASAIHQSDLYLTRRRKQIADPASQLAQRFAAFRSQSADYVEPLSPEGVPKK